MNLATLAKSTVKYSRQFYEVGGGCFFSLSDGIYKGRHLQFLFVLLKMSDPEISSLEMH